MSRDFTLEKYRELCKSLQNKYRIVTVRDFLTSHPEEQVAILRHDVDRRIGNALNMAELEGSLGISSTYYFRYPFTFNPGIIKTIHSLGHEIGYHYEVLSKTRGDYQKAIRLFGQELKEFRNICEINTICMHGSPLSRFHNLDLWRNFDFKAFNLIGEAYLSMNDVEYFSDTGRGWSGRNNIRDFIQPDMQREAVKKTDDLIVLIKKSDCVAIYLNTHPERWADSYPSWLQSISSDFIMNTGKKLIKSMRI